MAVLVSQLWGRLCDLPALPRSWHERVDGWLWRAEATKLNSIIPS